MTHKFAGSRDSHLLYANEGVVQSGWVIKMTEFGATNATTTFARRREEETTNEQIDDQALQMIGKTHHYAEWLICIKASVRHEIGMSYISCTYEGIYDDLEATKYSIEMSLSEEPIDTHPKFGEMAGKPSQMDEQLGYVPTTGAVFTGKNDLQDTFEEFLRTGDDNNGRQPESLVGMTQYLRPDIVFVERRTLGEGLTETATKNLIDDLGQRFTKVPERMTSPSGTSVDIPDFLPSDYNEADWLLISADYQPKGNGGILVRKWRLSGRYGWNEIIYEKGQDSIGASSRSPQAYGQGGSAVKSLNDDKIIFYGELQNEEAPPLNSTYEVDEEKKVIVNYSYVAKAGEGLDLGKSWITGSLEHEYDFLSAKEVSITGLEGGLEQVDIRFEGVQEEGDWKAQMSVNTNIEPIDSHPNFHEAKNEDNLIGGVLGEPKNGAIFNEKGAFQKWSSFIPEDTETQSWWKTKLDNESIIEGHMPNAMSKADSYIEAGVEWRETKYYDSLASSLEILKKIGYIKEPNSSDPSPPNVKSDIREAGFRNWLLVDANWSMVSTDFASGYVVTATYKLSGNRGWNSIIYEED
jgi:hypothetical protein